MVSSTERGCSATCWKKRSASSRRCRIEVPFINGYGAETVLTDTGRIDLSIPRDRQATFDPQLIAKYQRRFSDFDGKIVSMVARG